MTDRYMVAPVGDSASYVYVWLHETAEAAQAEAQRICDEYGGKVFVCEIVGAYKRSARWSDRESL